MTDPGKIGSTPERYVVLEIDDDGMGVTGNAQLLLGYIAGSIRGEYDLVGVDVKAGAMLVRCRDTPNIYRISIVQIEGVE